MIDLKMRKGALKTAIALCLACTLIAVMINTTAAEDNSACQFTGTVMAGDAKAPVGTRITAVIDGDEFHTHTPVSSDSSTYSLTILPPSGKSYPNGAQVIFKISGYEAEQTGYYFAGAGIDLDLSVTSHLIPYIPVSSTNSSGGSPVGSNAFVWGAIIGLSICTLAIVSITYYIRLLRRINRKRLLSLIADI
ncbi:MAG: hypothetical protein JSW38_09175 [Dehalococcoidia bacterium]|nr:MAG: hypothetical protein JSW38_09175 [Dehalococcoidia bacterium]